jgi:CRP-like cAMP-binding protein
MLLTTKIITIWDLVLLKIGKDPHKTIPLFEGMRPANARVVVLMGMLERYRKGEVILERGEMGHEMYVVLSGEVEIFDLVDGKPQILAVHLRGDIFGEMGLIRGTVRSASARAKDGTELLLLNEKIMARLQRKYPRISSRFFLNLSKILSNRLQDRTDQYLETSLLDS